MQFIPFSASTPTGSKIRNALTQLEQGRDGLLQILGSMSLMVDNAGTQDADYVKMANQCGFADGTTARAAFNELDSLRNKIDTDASVTSVKSAIAQACNKLRW